MKARVVIDNQLIWRIMRHPVYQKEFPFLRTAAEAASQAEERKGCGGCTKSLRRFVDLGHVKRSFAQMPDDRKRKLKEMLGADQVEVTYIDDRSRTVRLFF